MTNSRSPWPEDALEAATQTMRELPVPEGPSPAVLELTLETLEHASLPLRAARQHWWNLRSMSRLAVAAVLLFVVLIGTWWGLGDGGRKAMAENIMERLRQVQAVQFKANLEMNVTGRGLQTSEAQMTIVEPSWMILKVSGMTSIIDYDKQKMLVLDPTHRTAIVAEQKKLPRQTGSVNLLAELKRMDLENAEFLGARTIDGQTTDGYAVIQGDIHMNVWISTSTHLPVYTELEIASPMLPSAKMTYSDFNWAPAVAPYPPSFEIPSGYSVQNFDLDLSDITENDVVTLLRNAAQLNQDEFPENLGMLSIITNLRKSVANQATMSVISPPIQLPRGLTEKVMAISRGWIFIGDPQNGSDWRYAGNGVKLNEKNRPVLWYKPVGKETYRVIYADLSIREAASTELPAGEAVKPDWPTAGQ